MANCYTPIHPKGMGMFRHFLSDVYLISNDKWYVTRKILVFHNGFIAHFSNYGGYWVMERS